MNFCTVNLGCKVNAYESECIACELEKRGYARSEWKQPCDVTVIFTCAVTNMAAQKSRKMIHQARRYSPNTILTVAGCYAQIDPEALSQADILVGSAHKLEIPDLIEEYAAVHQPIRRTELSEKEPFEVMKLDRFEEKTRAYLRIQDGCNQFCAYCIIPYARGRERSMNPDTAVAEAARLAEFHHEIVLAGIHTGRYGKEYDMRLSGLIRRILNEVPQLRRIRISSIEMNEVDEDLIQLMTENTRVARHLHIPLQSGSDSVLKRMGRPYNTAEYYDRIMEIRKSLPDISISADLIVGFPGESEAEFQETLAFLKKCRFSFLHVFPYSMRKGTRAAAMPDQISPEIKKKRTAACMKLSVRLYDSYMDSMAGKQTDIICESQLNGQTFAHSSEYLPVLVPGICQQGDMFTVRLTGRNNHQMTAERL